MRRPAAHSPVTVFCISAVIAAVLTLPGIAGIYDWVWNGWLGFLNIPATGLNYMGGFFHELGHCSVGWSFGYIAIPTFDFQHGGGVCWQFGRFWPLAIAFYAGCGWLLRQLYLRYLYVPAGALTAFMMVHLFALFTEWSDLIITVMGHVGLALVAMFCIVRSFLNRGPRTRAVVERYLGMVFGIHVLLADAIMLGSLAYEPVHRSLYYTGKGGHGVNDLDKIADFFGQGIEPVAIFFAVLLTSMLGIAVLAGFILAPQFGDNGGAAEDTAAEASMPKARRPRRRDAGTDLY